MITPVIECSVKVNAEELLEVGEMFIRMGEALIKPDVPATETHTPPVEEGNMPLPAVPAPPETPAPPEPPAPPAAPEPPAPPAAPEPPAPPAAPEPPAPPAAPVALDSSGLPWDVRIHAKTKTKKVDGTWKALRGVDKALIASVSAELRAANPDNPADTPQADKNVVFMNLMQKVTGLTTPPAGSTVPKVTIDAITAIAVAKGAANIPALLQGPIETINAVAAEVDALCLTLG